MSEPIRVSFVDDEPSLRAAWEKLIAREPGMTFTGALPSAEGLGDHVRQSGATVVLIDLSMPGPDPLEATAELARENPECRVVVYSAHNNADIVQRAFAAGAWGFVDKLAPVAEILDALRRVAGGELAFPRGGPVDMGNASAPPNAL